MVHFDPATWSATRAWCRLDLGDQPRIRGAVSPQVHESWADPGATVSGRVVQITNHSSPIS
jgi:hypothetical protein